MFHGVRPTKLARSPFVGFMPQCCASDRQGTPTAAPIPCSHDRFMATSVANFCGDCGADLIQARGGEPYPDLQEASPANVYGIGAQRFGTKRTVPVGWDAATGEPAQHGAAPKFAGSWLGLHPACSPRVFCAIPFRTSRLARLSRFHHKIACAQFTRLHCLG